MRSSSGSQPGQAKALRGSMGPSLGPSSLPASLERNGSGPGHGWDSAPELVEGSSMGPGFNISCGVVDVVDQEDTGTADRGQQHAGGESASAAAASAALGAPPRRRGAKRLASHPEAWHNADPACAPNGQPFQLQTPEIEGFGQVRQPTGLASVNELLAEVDNNIHIGLTDILRNHVYVGLADPTMALLQSGTILYLVDIHMLSRDLFYQLVR